MQTRPYNILYINDEHLFFFKDQTCIISRLFDWANREGLNGRKVSDLFFVSPPNELMVRPAIIGCLLHVTDEAAKAIDEDRENQVINAVKDMLSE